MSGNKLAVGSTLGRWRIRERLGRGATASVYRGQDASGNDVALKVLHADLQGEASHSVERLQREIRLARRIDDPAVCEIFEIETLDNHLVLVMEFIPGQSLRTLLDAEGTLSPSRAAGIVHRVTIGVAAAHTLDILHRDLKPGNVMVRPNDSAVVLDFGYAVAPDVTRVTRAGDWVGTLAYAAPELLKNGSASRRSDIYALGVVLYECVAGELPFSGHNYGELASAIAFRDPLPPSRLQPNIDPKLDAAVMRAMRREPEERFASADELATALADLVPDLSCEEPTLTAVSPLPEDEEPTLTSIKAIPTGPPNPPVPFAELPTATNEPPRIDELGARRVSRSRARQQQRDTIPTPQGARDRLAVHKQLADLSAALIRERQAKGIIHGDNPELDGLERSAEHGLGQGNWSETIRSLELALETACAIEVDPPFLLTKAERFAAALAKKDQRQNLTHLQALLDRARTALERGDLEDGNKILNHAFDALRAR